MPFLHESSSLTLVRPMVIETPSLRVFHDQKNALTCSPNLKLEEYAFLGDDTLRLVVVAYLLLLIPSTFSIGDARCATELVRNGGFEDGISFWVRPGVEASVSDSYAHSGRYSLRTSNGSAWQTIQLVEGSNLRINLSFWVYLFTPTAVMGRTEAAVTVKVDTTTAAKEISYYVTPHKSEGATEPAIMIPNLEPNKWNNVKLIFDEDFRKSFLGVELRGLKEITIKFWSFKTYNPIPYWDDVSIASEAVSGPITPTLPPPTPTPTQSPSPTPTLPPTLRPTPQTESASMIKNIIDNYSIPILVVVLLGAIAGALVIQRRRSKTQEPSQVAGQRYCINCGSPVAENTKYCTRCGSPQ